MATVKPKTAREEPETTKDEPEFVGPPLIPGLPPFFRWIGYFDVGPGDTLKEIHEWRKRTGRA